MLTAATASSGKQSCAIVLRLKKSPEPVRRAAAISRCIRWASCCAVQYGPSRSHSLLAAPKWLKKLDLLMPVQLHLGCCWDNFESCYIAWTADTLLQQAMPLTVEQGTSSVVVSSCSKAVSSLSVGHATNRAFATVKCGPACYLVCTAGTMRESSNEVDLTAQHKQSANTNSSVSAACRCLNWCCHTCRVSKRSWSVQHSASKASS